MLIRTMNTRSRLSANRLIVMTFACLMAVCLAACGEDDDNDNPENKILGTWIYKKQSYLFNSDGTGEYNSGGDVWGDFKYNLSGSSVYIRITFVNSKYGSVWRDEKRGTYYSYNDTFGIDGKSFVRKK